VTDEFRKLNEAGIAKFADYIKSGATGPAPFGLLTDPNTSSPLKIAIRPVTMLFKDRYDFGCYLVRMMEPFDVGTIAGDEGLWTGLALFWFDQLCPAIAGGSRNPAARLRYILDMNDWRYHRHLVRTTWQVVRDHGKHSRFLLLSSYDSTTDGIHRSGDLMEQFMAKQALSRSKAIIKAASMLYGDPVTGRPIKGSSNKNTAGCARRLTAVLAQLDLNFDTDLLPDGNLLDLLPKEFDKFKGNGKDEASSGEALPLPETEKAPPLAAAAKVTDDLEPASYIDLVS
jgi:hypothetical protein